MSDRPLAIERLTADDTAAITALLTEFPHLSVTTDFGAANDRIVQFHVAYVLARTAKEGSGVWGVREGRALRGLVCFDPLPFESGIFDRKMGGISMLAATGEPATARPAYNALIAAVRQMAAAEGYVHLACRLRVEDTTLTHCLERAGFLLADTTFEFGWKTDRIRIEEKPNAWIVTDILNRQTRIFKLAAAVRPFTEADLPAMKALAREAFTARTRTRYTADESLPLERTGELYARWLENGFQGTFADVVRVATDEHGPIGFETLKLDRELSEALGISIGLFGIAAVVPTKAGRGVQASMHCDVLKWCSENGVKFARGRVLVDNYSMQKLCLITGAAVTAVFHTFHLHVDA